MTRPKVELNKIRGINEIIDDSTLFVKQNWTALLKSYVTICGFFWVAAIVISVFNQIHFRNLAESGVSMYDGQFWFGVVFELLNYTTITVTGLSFMSLYHQKGNEAPTTAEVWSYFKYYFLRVLGSNLVVTIALLLGTVCCFFPGIYLWPVMSLVPVAIVIDNYPIRSAVNRSFALIAKRWGQVFGVLILCMFLMVAIAILFAIPLGIGATLYVFLTGGQNSHIVSIITNLLLHIIQFVYLFPLIALTLCYFNLAELQEDSGLLTRIKMLGQKTDNVAGAADLGEEEY